VGEQRVDCARSTVRIGTAPCAWALSKMRRTLTWKFGLVKRPTHTALGSRAIFQTRSALDLWPERCSERHCSIDDESWST
jgi:hypothetical protein